MPSIIAVIVTIGIALIVFVTIMVIRTYKRVQRERKDKENN